MPLLLHGVERAEPQPYHTSLFVNRFVDPPNDDGIGLRGLNKGIASLCVLSWLLKDLKMLALAEVDYLGVDVQLASCGLGLGQRRIVSLLHYCRDLAPPEFLGVLHGRE